MIGVFLLFFALGVFAIIAARDSRRMENYVDELNCALVAVASFAICFLIFLGGM